MSNPYASPSPPESSGELGPSVSPVPAGVGGFSSVNQVTVVSILMIVQGALAILMGLVFVGYGAVFGALFAGAKDSPFDGPNEPSMWIMVGVFAGLSLPPLVSGILQVSAGIRNLSYRGHTLGIVALFSGLGQILTFYCLPTAIGLMIYGLIIYFNASVKRAFALGEEGYTKSQILGAFLQYQPAYQPATMPNPPGPPTNPPTTK